MSNAVGHTTIDERALERIIRQAADSVPGTTHVGMSLENPGGRSLPRFDIMVDDKQQTVSVEAFICATWPAPTVTVAEKVRSTIAEWVEAFTGYAATHVNVYVGSVMPGESRITAAQVAQAPRPNAQTPEVRRNHAGRVSSPRVIPQSAATDTQAGLKPVTVRTHDVHVDVEVHSNQDLVEVSAPDDCDIYRPSTPEESAIVPRFAPDFPQEFDAPTPEIPREVPLRKISVHNSAPKVKVRTPRPPQLRKVKTVRHDAPLHPRVPREQPLKPFAVVDMAPEIPIEIRPTRIRQGRR
ncbi:Protein of uncharacterised function (DUF322) [Corynebacterium renale]|uniref:Asp23/Gls24 family envelope stress response protein n=1 Tax=Corynebacterium renale TaxID=1724 RepID=UPI000DA2D751|nr:Asp23/Gls24 family envelope stress response protein [Corynebacterium renale]SQG64022.1 Protein of uncharacterised function (DUF322) [Corynebacterium renale]STD03639.1 Protein of uncharacterised function (DUF322) [Corynebacterium renale]